MKQGRHGDILLVAVDTKPPEEIVPAKRIVLAEGETTGHAHILTAPEVFEWQADGQRYVQVQGGPGILTHQEHGTRTIPPNTTYRVVPQQETDLSNEWRRVTD